MKKEKIIRLNRLLAVVVAFTLMTGCGNSSKKESCCEISNSVQLKNDKEMKYSKKYTNADFYTDGKFNEAVARKAYLDMFEFYGIPFTSFMKS